MKKLLAWFFILQGLSLFSVGAYQIFLNEYPNTLAFANYKYEQPVVQTVNQTPVRVSIKSLDINTPLQSAVITNDKWQVSEVGASYLATSPIPGTEGNSIVYAHNRRNLFGNLINAKVGQEVEVAYADGSKKTFVISYTSEVSPEESTILAPSKDKRITLYTCTGFLDSKRFVAVAILKG